MAYFASGFMSNALEKNVLFVLHEEEYMLIPMKENSFQLIF